MAYIYSLPRIVSLTHKRGNCTPLRTYAYEGGKALALTQLATSSSNIYVRFCSCRIVAVCTNNANIISPGPYRFSGVDIKDQLTRMCRVSYRQSSSVTKWNRCISGSGWLTAQLSSAGEV